VIISDAHRYVFIEVPQTASSAIAAELLSNYGGRRIYRKHSGYEEFARAASPEELRYTVLATVRNPLDIVVSKFLKARDDHDTKYTETSVAGAPWGFRLRPEARERAFIARHGADFARFVRAFYPFIYNNRACLLPAHARVLHYENLDAEFAAWLKSIGLSAIRPVPLRNATSGRDRDFTSWYDERLRLHAAKVFGPYMERWGYSAPPGWPPLSTGALRRALFAADTALRRAYFHRIHYGWIMPREDRTSATAGDGR